MNLFSTAYLPPIAYVAKLAMFDNITIEQHETFPKQTYRNRAEILTANGVLSLYVPATRTNGNHTYTKDIEISYAENWNVQHWRAIESAYSSAPYFLYYKDEIEAILMKRHKYLLDLNRLLLEYCLKRMKIACAVNVSDTYLTDMDEGDYRNTFSPKRRLDSEIFATYSQVFDTKFPFQANLSIIDLLFNLGPDSKQYLNKVASNL